MALTHTTSITPHTSPEKACPLRRCSDPWLSSLPKCSRISSSRWLYVIGPPDMLTKCSLSRRKDTCLPVLYIVPLTCKTMGNRSKKARLPFLSFSLMLSHSCDPVNNSFCLSSQSPFVPARKLEAVIWPLNKLQGHVVELDKNYGLRACGQEDFFWFGKLGL